MVNDWQQDALKVPNGMIEEIAHEIYENADYNETFQDARSLFGAGTDVSEHLTLESVDIERNSDLGEDASVVQNAPLDMKENVKGDWVIPIYEGEVVLPHPGKMPVSAWMYPVQMISIPSTEVAFEKGWEPGGNKYTLYSIHVSFSYIYFHKLLIYFLFQRLFHQMLCLLFHVNTVLLNRVLHIINMKLNNSIRYNFDFMLGRCCILS